MNWMRKSVFDRMVIIRDCNPVMLGGVINDSIIILSNCDNDMLRINSEYKKITNVLLLYLTFHHRIL